MLTKVDPFVQSLANLKDTEPLTVEESAAYGEVLRLLRERRASSILLLRGGRLAGVLTERDILSKCLLEDIPDTTPVSKLMTPDPVTIREDATVGEALAKMHKHHVRNLPMEDARGRLTGLLTVGRLIRFLAFAFPAEVVNLPPKPAQVTEEVEGA